MKLIEIIHIICIRYYTYILYVYIHLYAQSGLIYVAVWSFLREFSYSCVYSPFACVGFLCMWFLFQVTIAI